MLNCSPKNFCVAGTCNTYSERFYGWNARFIKTIFYWLKHIIEIIPDLEYLSKKQTSIVQTPRLGNNETITFCKWYKYLVINLMNYLENNKIPLWKLRIHTSVVKSIVLNRAGRQQLKIHQKEDRSNKNEISYTDAETK